MPRPERRRNPKGAEQGEHGEGDAELVVNYVGGHGAEHGDHHYRCPVRKSVVASGGHILCLGQAHSKCVGWYPVSPQETANIRHYRGGRTAKWPNNSKMRPTTADAR